VLHEAIDLYLKRHKPEGADDSLKTATLMWSTAHGIATLQHNRMLDTFDEDADADTLLRTATRAILRSDD